MQFRVASLSFCLMALPALTLAQQNIPASSVTGPVGLSRLNQQTEGTWNRQFFDKSGTPFAQSVTPDMGSDIAPHQGGATFKPDRVQFLPQERRDALTKQSNDFKNSLNSANKPITQGSMPQARKNQLTQLRQNFNQPDASATPKQANAQSSRRPLPQPPQQANSQVAQHKSAFEAMQQRQLPTTSNKGGSNHLTVPSDPQARGKVSKASLPPLSRTASDTSVSSFDDRSSGSSRAGSTSSMSSIDSDRSASRSTIKAPTAPIDTPKANRAAPLPAPQGQSPPKQWNDVVTNLERQASGKYTAPSNVASMVKNFR